MARSSMGTEVISLRALVSPSPRASRPFDLGVRSAATASFLSATATRSLLGVGANPDFSH
jgi:hypothetical protein